MRRFKNSAFFLLVFLIFLLVSCSSPKDANIKQENKLSLSETENIINEYNRTSEESFFVSLDFELTSGRVDWDLKSPKGELLYKGYAVHENGKTYRQLVYPTNFLNGNMSNMEAIVDGPDFNFLQFEGPVQKGVYQLIITPDQSVGSYKVEWHSDLPRK